ncbi:MAG: diaminopimelate epimerase [Acidimicrobiales bacterium]|nr:diaminopimelate epimerase [Acidimicrobiales bacterium]MCB9394583.1 diaminopimelate epimerase [Acidimicrobiaceae bacterium]
MTTLQLTKHHGLGNDFLVVFHPPVPPARLPALAVALCDRRTGIGADGLLVAESEPGYAARMWLYNADGSRAEMSGNGIRCFAQALALRRGDLDGQTILTDAGDRHVRLVATDRADTIEASVDMGEIRAGSEPEGWAGIGAHPDRPVLHLDTGNPHTVVGVDEVAVVDLQALGAHVPGTNLEIVEPGDEPHVIRMRVHERGAGITQACGTGACASAYAARAWGLVPAATTEIVVQMDGGRAKVRLDDPAPGRATLVGPSVLIGRIEVEIDDHLGSAPANGVDTTHEGNTTSA